MKAAALWFFTGAVIAVLATFPLAALCALLFRFPIPFDSYRSGPAAIRPALFAVVFYGLIGGFTVQAALGGVAGLLAQHYGAPDRGRRWRLCLALAAVASIPGIAVLSILDFVIGPW